MAGQNYQDNKYSFPRDDINPALKAQAPYSLSFAQAAYGLHLKDQNGSRNARNDEIALLRLYAQGRQPVEKYLDLLCPKDKHGKRKTYMDISSDPISIIPKFKSIVKGKFMQMHHEIGADALDEKSGGERRAKRHRLWAKSQLQARLEPAQALMEAGATPEQAQEIIPKTIEELNMMETAGSFKLLWETGMELLLKDSFNISDWDTDTKDRLYDDIFNLASIATRDYTDKASGKAMCRYVDQEKVIKRFSREKRSRNIDYAGEIISISPNTLRIESGETLSQETIDQIIEETNQRTAYDYTYENGIEGFYERHGNMTINVLDLTWKTLDIIKQEKVKGKDGETYFNNVDYNFEKRNDAQEILEGKMQMVYSCKWVIGTDHVYDYGIEEDIIRPTPKTVRLPFNFYKLAEKSMLELAIPFEDGVNLAWARLQNGVAKSAPPGIAVDISALKNVTNGINKLKPLEVLQIRRETGDLLFSATTHHSQVINPNASKPIFDLPGGAGGYLKEQMELIAFNIGMIRDVTAINELMDASTPNPNIGLGTAEIAAEGTNNSLYVLYNAYKAVKEGTAENLSYRIQNIIRYKDYTPYENVIGSGLLEMFKQGSPISSSHFGIKLTLKPQEKERQALMQTAGMAFQNGILKYSDMMFLQQEVMNGSLKYARMYIMRKEEEYREKQEAATQANTEAQSQEIMKQQENALEGRKEEVTHQTNEDIRERVASSEIELDEYGEKNYYKKEEDDNKSKNKVVENLTK